MLGRVLGTLSQCVEQATSGRPKRLRKRIRLRNLVAWSVQHLDVLRYTNKVFRHLLFQGGIIDLVNNAPKEVLGWLYDYLDDLPEKRPGAGCI